MCAAQAGNFDTALLLFRFAKDYRDSQHQARCISLYEQIRQTDDPFLKCSLCIELGDFLNAPQHYGQTLPALYRSYTAAVESGNFALAQTYQACLTTTYENVAGYQALCALGPPQTFEEIHAFLSVCEQYHIPAQPFSQSSLIQMGDFLKGDLGLFLQLLFFLRRPVFLYQHFYAVCAYFLPDGIGVDQNVRPDVLIDYQSPNSIILRYQKPRLSPSAQIAPLFHTSPPHARFMKKPRSPVGSGSVSNGHILSAAPTAGPASAGAAAHIGSHSSAGPAWPRLHIRSG